MDFKIIFCDTNARFACDYENYLRKFNNVSHHLGKFQNLPEGSFDCIVYPISNSFGLSDMGFGAQLNYYFYEINEFIIHMQKQLIEKNCGFQSPGSCTLFETNISKCKYVAYTPISSYPLPISNLETIYHCMWNTLITAHKHNEYNYHPDTKINTIVLPGIGGSKVKSEVVTQLIALAIEDYIDFLNNKHTMDSNSKYLINWSTATTRYKKLYKYLESIDKTVYYNSFDLINLTKLRL